MEPRTQKGPRALGSHVRRSSEGGFPAFFQAPGAEGSGPAPDTRSKEKTTLEN